MTTLEIVLIVLAVGLLLVCLYLAGSRRRLHDRLTTRETELAAAQLEQATLREKLRSESERQQERREDFDRQMTQMADRFETLSEVITRRRASELSQTNRQELEMILRPLRESLEKMDRSLKESGESSSRRAGELDRQIQILVDQTQFVGDKADRLAEAMSTRGKVQGDWGELQLERLLEQEGFRKGVEYDTQVSYTRGGETLRPDMVLHLPDGRDVMVDAKVSLRAYIRYVEAADETARTEAEADLYRDLMEHVRELTSKRYHKLETPERSTFHYTLMFVPNTAAVMLVGRTDLRERALKGGVFIVTPETLMLFLKIIAEAWSYQRQEEHIAEVMRMAGKIVSQTDNLIKDFDQVHTKLTDALKAYDEARTHLTGQQGVVRYAERISDLIK